MRSAKKVLVVCVAWGMGLGAALPAPSQDPSQQQAPVIRTQVSLVNLFVTVRDKSKRIVTDLKQDDFKVAEDGKPQQIAFFSKEVTLPITLALLLDTSGSEQYMLPSIQDAGGRFIERVLRKGDEALVMSFDSDVDLLSDFTDDRGQIDRAIRKARINVPSAGSIGNNPGPIGSRQITGTALYDAIYLACNEKLNTEAGRKAIVIVSAAHGHRGAHLTGGRPALWRRKRQRGTQNHGRNRRPHHLRQLRKTYGRSVRSDFRGAAQPVHARLLSDQRGARRKISQNQSRHVQP